VRALMLGLAAVVTAAALAKVVCLVAPARAGRPL